MRKFLTKIKVIQEKVTNKDDRFRKRTWYRLNPYNPLSYITIVLTLLLAVVLFGVVGFKEQVDLKNPFKWK